MPQRILVVEDEPSIADNIIYALSTEGFEPQWVATGEEARRVLAEETVSLVILDIGLPDANGFELAREMIANYGVPIMFLTARADEIDRIVGLELGADDYIVKPFSPRELTARVKAVLRRVKAGSSDRSESVVCAPLGLTIDEERFRVSYQGTGVEFSRYEFRILSILAKSPGRVYTREQLMQLAWEEPEMSLERTVDTHIKTIRQKLKAVCPDRDLILTHRGIGYSLKEEE